MVPSGYKKSRKVAQNFYCKFCDYECCKPNDYKKHISTDKHQKAQNGTKMVPKSRKVAQNENEPVLEYKCDCGKVYKYRQGLYRHQKTCKVINEVIDDNIGLITSVTTADLQIGNYKNNEENNGENIDLKNMVVKLVNDNSEMKNIIMNQQKQIGELIPKIGNTINNTTNKTKLNINVFLNEQCKDAITMNQFIDQIEVSMKNLLTTKNKGSAEGITDIIIENMNKLSLYERPLHCTDVKRETLYVKNEEWEKDNSKDCINNAIRKIENKQLKNIQMWLDEHPDWEGNPKLQEEYMKLVKNCTTSLEENGEEDKVRRKICNELYIQNND